MMGAVLLLIITCTGSDHEILVLNCSPTIKLLSLPTKLQLTIALSTVFDHTVYSPKYHDHCVGHTCT